MPTVESGGGERVSTRSMCVVRNFQVLRTTHIGLELRGTVYGVRDV